MSIPIPGIVETLGNAAFLITQDTESPKLAVTAHHHEGNTYYNLWISQDGQWNRLQVERVINGKTPDPLELYSELGRLNKEQKHQYHRALAALRKNVDHLCATYDSVVIP